jgi:hypothetical protein
MYGKEFHQPVPQPRLNFDSIQDSLQKGMNERSGYASVMYQRLLEEIAEFESYLNPDEEIAAYLASFGREIYLQIEDIGHRDPYYIIFSGTTEKGQKARLVQHVSQSSILFIPIKVKPEENREPRRFGFRISDNED